MVCEADFLAAQYPDVIDRSLLLAGALLHDLAKCEEFTTSALGLVTDYSMAGNRVVLLFSHRLYQFPAFDRVLYLDGGQGVFAAHETLMRECPPYAKLFAEQQEGGGRHALSSGFIFSDGHSIRRAALLVNEKSGRAAARSRTGANGNNSAGFIFGVYTEWSLPGGNRQRRPVSGQRVQFAGVELLVDFRQRVAVRQPEDDHAVPPARRIERGIARRLQQMLRLVHAKYAGNRMLPAYRFLAAATL